MAQGCRPGQRQWLNFWSATAASLDWGTPENDVEAYRWFSIAASQGDSEAKRARDSLADWMAPQLVDVAQQDAARFVARPERAVADSDDIPSSPEILQ